MTSRTILYDDLNTPEVDALLNAPIIEQRVRYYTQYSYICKYVVSVLEDEARICYAETSFTLSMGKQRLYKKRTGLSGFTYNKLTKKVEGWRGAKIGDFVRAQLDAEHRSMHKFLEMRNLDWLLKTDKNIGRFITKTTLGGILSGKITNPELLVKRYITTSLKCKSLHWRKVRDFISGSTSDTPSLHKIINTSTAPNEMMLLVMRLEQRRKTDNPDTTERNLARQHWDLLLDAMKNADILMEKINPRWSLRRLRQEHDRLSDQIMGYLAQNGEALSYDGQLQLPNNMELLSNEAEVYREGHEMRHCLFSNYWKEIKSISYFALRMLEPERCTVGIRSNGHTYILDQMYGKRNSSVKESTRDIISNWLQKSDVQTFFFQNQYF